MLAVLEATLFPLGQFQEKVRRRRRTVRPQVESDSRFTAADWTFPACVCFWRIREEQKWFSSSSFTLECSLPPRRADPGPFSAQRQQDRRVCLMTRVSGAGRPAETL